METTQQKIARLQQEIKNLEKELRVLQCDYAEGDVVQLTVKVNKIDPSDATISISYLNWEGEETTDWVKMNQISKVENS